jgi:RNA polymerase sigma-70 factor (ECF subfamily)
MTNAMTAPSPVTTDALWSAFASPLRGFIARRVPPSDREDVLQDVFIRVQRNIAEVEAAERLDAWIFRIARSAIIDRARTTRRYEGLTERFAREGTASAEVDAEDPVVAEIVPCLTPMIAMLDAPYREAIALTEIEGLTHAAAAARLGLSVSGMKSRVQRGRDQLRGMLLACCRIATDARGKPIDCEPRGGRACGSCDE